MKSLINYLSLKINKTEIMKDKITAEDMIKSLGLEKKPKLNLYVVVLSFFYVIGIACGLAMYFDNDKTYGLVLALIIIPALILNYIEIVKYLINMLKKY